MTMLNNEQSSMKDRTGMLSSLHPRNLNDNVSYFLARMRDKRAPVILVCKCYGNTVRSAEHDVQ